MKSLMIGALIGLPSSFGVYYLVLAKPSLLGLFVGFFVTSYAILMTQKVRGE